MESAVAVPGAAPEPRELRLFQLTWPLFLEILLFMLMGTADTLMLSGISDEAVSAVGVVNQYLSLCILIMEMVSNGASVVVAQYLGARRNAEAARISALAITLNLLLGVTVSAAFLLFGNALLARMNLTGQVMEYARTYLSIAGGCIFLQALINVFASLLRTYGFTKESMFVSLGMNAVHILGNALLIFGLLGAPKLGVAGAAVSTVVSRSTALLVFVWMLYRVMGVKMVARDDVAFSKEYILKILKIGIPSAVEQLTYHSCQTVFLFYVTFLGPTALASRQYAMSISQYVFLFSIAVGVGTSIIVGRLVGARRTEDAYRRVLESLKWSVAITVAVDVLAILFRKPLVGLFTPHADVIELTSRVIVLGLLLETGRSFNLVLVNALRAAGDAPFTVYMGFTSMVCLSLSLGYVFVFKLNLGLAGVWLAVAVDEWTRGITFWFRWRSRAWQSKSLVSAAEPPPTLAAG
ncbi:MATE family efflux transporter [Corallococcus sp. M34]|uniref:MATE family efflux transporter n=1 Tax=Citreicoccus inhibens TaxID=2849499 RepID=UPI001C2455AF|nr:MATE family efflux transporter [Citreicoccus inhibens]MBU8898473.1 MATE family efflux transporter [Citreicoccus inhibens]